MPSANRRVAGYPVTGLPFTAGSPAVETDQCCPANDNFDIESPSDSLQPNSSSHVLCEGCLTRVGVRRPAANRVPGLLFFYAQLTPVNRLNGQLGLSSDNSQKSHSRSCRPAAILFPIL